tara:strand:+ start:504 stop:701 length:198 start_codon:yes stop_codon:yes gene_type:complete
MKALASKQLAAADKAEKPHIHLQQNTWITLVKVFILIHVPLFVSVLKIDVTETKGPIPEGVLKVF